MTTRRTTPDILSCTARRQRCRPPRLMARSRVAHIARCIAVALPIPCRPRRLRAHRQQSAKQRLLGNRTRVPSRLTGSTCPRQGGRSSQSESATRGSALTCRPWVSSVATIPATPVACSRKDRRGRTGHRCAAPPGSSPTRTRCIAGQIIPAWSDPPVGSWGPEPILLPLPPVGAGRPSRAPVSRAPSACRGGGSAVGVECGLAGKDCGRHLPGHHRTATSPGPRTRTTPRTVGPGRSELGDDPTPDPQQDRNRDAEAEHQQRHPPSVRHPPDRGRDPRRPAHRRQHQHSEPAADEDQAEIGRHRPNRTGGHPPPPGDEVTVDELDAARKKPLAAMNMLSVATRHESS